MLPSANLSSEKVVVTVMVVVVVFLFLFVSLLGWTINLSWTLNRKINAMLLLF